MRPNTQLDYAVFQLTPTRTRCELHIAAQGMTYKLASGLLKPFVAHLSAAKEQIAGGGYSIRLEPPDPGSATWFTKGTMERFVRFVSTPEVLERVSTVEMELLELEEAIRMQANGASEDNQIAEDRLSKLGHLHISTGGMPTAPANLEKPAKESLEGAEAGTEDTSKQWLLRALDGRRMLLLQEQGIAFARAIAAGFSIEHVEDLIEFAENFGAMRLREACTQFMALSKKRQESGLWQEDLKLAAAETAQADMAFSDNVAIYMGSREHSDLQGRDLTHDEFRRASLPSEGRLLTGDSGLEKLTRRGSLDELTGEFWQVAARMRSSGTMESANADWSSNWQTPMSGRMSEERQHPIMAAWQGQPHNYFMRNMHPLPLHGPMHPSLPPSLGVSKPSQSGLPYPPYFGNPYMAQAYAEANGWQMPPPVPPPYWPGHLGYTGTPVPTANEHGDVVLPATRNQGGEPTIFNNREVHGEVPAHTQRPASGLLVSKDTQESFGTQKHLAVSDEHGDGVLPTTRNQGAEPTALSSSKVHGEQPGRTQRPASGVLVTNDAQETVGTQKHLTSTDDREHESSSGLLVSKDAQESFGTQKHLAVSDEHGDGVLPTTRNQGAEPTALSSSEVHGEQPGRTQRPAIGVLVTKDAQEMFGTQKHLTFTDDREHESSHHMDGEPPEEMTRRLPIRSSSPSRRSASPLKKVQIGRTGSKRSGTVVIRNINHITHSTQSRTERENNDRDSLESWSEDTEEGKCDEESKAEPVRARVQDVIGLFERKKNSNDAKEKPLKEESRRLPSKNSVLSRWTASGALQRDAGVPDESLAIDRIKKRVSGAFAHDVAEMKCSQPNVLQNKEERASLAEEGMLLFPDREGASRSKDMDSTAILTDDSFTVPEVRNHADAGESRMLDAELELASETVIPDDSFIVFEQPLSRNEASNTWTKPLNRQSEVAINQDPDGDNCDSAKKVHSFEPDDVFMVPDRSDDTATRSWNMAMDYDMQVLAAGNVGQEQNHVDEEFPLGNNVHEHEDGEMGDKSKAASIKKVSDRDAKARAMQEMLERRKAASGSRSGRPNPLEEAQLRAEKLRAYKAGLQKSKQEKEEEDRKRIEDLKSQRKGRIAARKSPVGVSASQSPSTRQGPQTPTLSVSKSSPTTISHKLSGSSPRSSINVTASTSPNVSKNKAASGIKVPRTPTGTLQGNENALSRSVPSLSELKRETKATLAVRSSTGSQRLSQLKKNLKEADSNSSPKANGLTDEKKRSLPLATVRKGIPPAKDTKGEDESLTAVVKPIKGLSTAATKQRKKLVNSRGDLKPSPPKEHALETAEGSAPLEQVDATNDAAMEVLIVAQNSKAGIDIQETSRDILETSVNNDCATVQEIDADSGYAQIRAPATTEPEVLSTADDSMCHSGESTVELAPSNEAAKLAEESKEASIEASISHAGSSEGEHSEAENDTKADEDYHAPIAHVSPRDDNFVTCKESDIREDERNVQTELPNPEQYNPPRALPCDSPLHTPSKNLPRLHEAIQQAHSPEYNPGVGRLRKKWGELGSQKPLKDHHAKGLKRLLLLGRKSNRNPTQNAADWVSMTSEVDDDSEGIPSGSGKNVGIGSAPTNTDGISSRADKPRNESNSGSSSSKGSRSFFSLSTFRAKSDGKS